VQRTFYSKEIKLLELSKPVEKPSPLVSLNPILGKDGLLRVAGRLENSSLSEERKKPIIIPSRSLFAKLFVRYVHEKYFHAGFNFVVTYFNWKYWFVNGIAKLVKSVIKNCVHCTRVKGIVAQQLMGQLPLERVQFTRPFANVGIDYAGPFQCRCVAHRTARYSKIYIVVFVCFTVPAVHLEIVSDLTTDGFLLAFQRFSARRGLPANVFTDNATNFVGASNLFASGQSEFVEFATKEGFRWNFIPPLSPSFGGIWEAGVKSMKKHMMMATKNSIMNFEEYSTLFTRIEAVLNCRPLCYRKSLSQENEIITPSHFLIGQPLTSLPIIDQEEIPLSRRLELVQNHLRGIWKVWSKDYLNQLQIRPKSTGRQPNLAINDIVLLKDQRCPPYRWPLAKIIRTYPASDGLVCVVEVKTADATYH
jgi:hypothetical protein